MSAAENIPPNGNDTGLHLTPEEIQALICGRYPFAEDPDTALRNRRPPELQAQYDEVLLRSHVALMAHANGWEAVNGTIGEPGLSPDVLCVSADGSQYIAFEVRCGQLNLEEVNAKIIHHIAHGITQTVWISPQADVLRRRGELALGIELQGDLRQPVVEYELLREGRIYRRESPLEDVIKGMTGSGLEAKRLKESVDESPNTVQIRDADIRRVLCTPEDGRQYDEMTGKYSSVVARRQRMKDATQSLKLSRWLSEMPQGNWAAFQCAELVHDTKQVPQINVLNEQLVHIRFDGANFLMVSWFEDAYGQNMVPAVYQHLTENPSWYWVDRGLDASQAKVYAQLAAANDLASRRVTLQELTEVLQGERVLKSDIPA